MRALRPIGSSSVCVKGPPWTSPTRLCLEPPTLPPSPPGPHQDALPILLKWAVLEPIPVRTHGHARAVGQDRLGLSSDGWSMEVIPRCLGHGRGTEPIRAIAPEGFVPSLSWNMLALAP